MNWWIKHIDPPVTTDVPINIIMQDITDSNPTLEGDKSAEEQYNKTVGVW